MALRRLAISEDLADRLDVVAAQHGGLPEALDYLLRTVEADQIDRDGITPAAAIGKFKTKQNNDSRRERLTQIAIRINLDELSELDLHAKQSKLTHAQWVEALVRFRIRRKPQFAWRYRAQLATIGRRLWEMEKYLGKLARPMSRPTIASQEFLERATAFRDLLAEIRELRTVIASVFDENMSYWSGDAPAHDPSEHPDDGYQPS